MAGMAGPGLKAMAQRLAGAKKNKPMLPPKARSLGTTGMAPSSMSLGPKFKKPPHK